MFNKVLKDQVEALGSFNVRPVENQCGKCQWFNQENPLVCEAFPEGIPVIILLGEFDHRAPFNVDGLSDEGITFLERKEVLTNV